MAERKSTVRGAVSGRHAPTKTNKLITMRAAIINSLLVWTVLDDA